MYITGPRPRSVPFWLSRSRCRSEIRQVLLGRRGSAVEDASCESLSIFHLVFLFFRLILFLVLKVNTDRESIYRDIFLQGRSAILSEQRAETFVDAVFLDERTVFAVTNRGVVVELVEKKVRERPLIVFDLLEELSSVEIGLCRADLPLTH